MAIMSGEVASNGWSERHQGQRIAGETPFAGSLVCETVGGLEEFRRLDASWTALERAHPALVLPFEALIAVAEHAPDDEVRAIVVRDGDEIVLAWPFAITTLGPMRRAVRLGRAVQCYDDILLAGFATPRERERALHLAWREIAHWDDVDCLAFSTIKAASAILDIPAIAGQVRQVDEGPRVELTSFESLGDYRATLSKNRRGSLKRRRKKLEKAHDVTFAEVEEPAARRDALDLAMSFKAAWLDAQHIVSVAYASDYYAPAFREIAGLAGCTGHIRIFTLRADQEIVAVEVGILANGVYQSHIGAFAPAWASAGVGAVLTLDVIGWCIARGVREYDMLPPDTAFKRDFTDDAARSYDAVIPLSALGHIALPLARDGKALAKKAHAALPSPLRWVANRLVAR